MSCEPPSSPDSLSRKRKRSSESEVSFSTSLTALSQFAFEQGPLTPVSSYSAFSNLKLDQPAFPADEGSVDARNSLSGEDHITKRQFMSPRRRHATMFSNNGFSGSPRPGLISRVSSFGSSLSLPQYFPADAGQQCHVCRNSVPTVPNASYRWPTCTTCNQATCYICIRKCQGPGHPEAHPLPGQEFGSVMSGPRDICAQCCVEVGYEGIVWCNRCYSIDDQGQERGRYTVGAGKKEMQSGRIGMVADWLSHCSD